MIGGGEWLGKTHSVKASFMRSPSPFQQRGTPTMLRRSVIIGAMLLSLMSAVSVPMAGGAEPLPPAVKWIPNDALLVVELTNPEAFF